MKIEYKLEKIADKIYHCSISDHYDLTMTFCRVQEFYESPFKNIRNKNFTLIELMDSYSKLKGDGCFTYPQDWGGFNVPRKAVYNCYFNNKVKDENYYDQLVMEMHNTITNDHGDSDYYLIGTNGADSIALRHEIAHGLFYLNKKYRENVISIIKEISEKSYNQFRRCLLDIGYTSCVIDDEINAYLSTQDTFFWESIKKTKNLEKITKKLQTLFEQYEEILQ